jgi:hypothetical protein
MCNSSNFVYLATHLLIGHASAQSPDWMWARSGIGADYDQATAVASDSLGHVIMAGYFASDSVDFGGITLHNNTPGFDDLFIVKYTADGSVAWAKSLGGNFDDKAYAVSTDAAGNILLAANFASTTITVGDTSFTNAGSPGDILLVKFGPDGSVLWATREGGPSLEIPYACTFDHSGNMIVAGRFSSNSITFGSTTLLQAGSMDVFVVKYDAEGNVLWASGAGGGSNDEAYAVVTDVADNVILAGYYTQEADFGTITLPNPGLANIFIAQCDGVSGDFLWAKEVASDGDERALAIALDTDDHIYAAGFFQGDSLPLGATTLFSTDFDNGWLARFDVNGEPEWAHALNARSKVQGITVANEAVYACGVFREDSLVYGDDVLPIDGGSDLFLLKSSLSGDPRWIAKQTNDGESDEDARALSADPSGLLLVAGMFDSDLVTFGNAELVNSNGYDAFVIKTGDTDVGLSDGPSMTPLVLYPNPNDGRFSVVIPPGAVQLDIIDPLGRFIPLRRIERIFGTMEFNLPYLTPGAYILRMSTAGHVHSTRFLVGCL